MSKEQWAAKLNLQFWVRSRLCWQRIRGRAEVKTLQMKKENTQNATLKRTEMNSTEMAQDSQKRIARQEQIQAKPGPVTVPYVQMGLGMNSVGWIHERSTKDMDPGWPSPTNTENGRNICFFQYFSIFPICFNFCCCWHWVDSGSAGVQGRSLSSGQWGFSEDSENLTQMNLALI